MKSQAARLSAVLLCLTAAACNGPASPAIPDTFSSGHGQPAGRAAWAGIYQGTVPYDGCDGIATTLTLHSNLTYRLQETFLGTAGPRTADITGTFVWEEGGRFVRLDAMGDSRRYLVGNGYAEELHADYTLPEGRAVSAYRLQKTH